MSKRRDRPKRGQMVEDPAYKAYLASTQWKAKRARIFETRGHRCEVCGFGERLSLHHLTYVRLYDELDSDLLITCESCHAALHGKWNVVRAIGAKQHEKLTRVRLDNWKSRPSTPLREPSPVRSVVESHEWNGYDPFVNAASPVAWRPSRAPTASLKDRF